MSVRERILAFYRRYPAMIALTYFPFYLLGFVLVEQVVKPRYIIWCPLDDLIPFCEYFIVPYATWFVELAVIPLLLLQYDRKQYYYLCAVMFTGMTLCLGLYLIFPNGLDLRVEITRQNIFADLVRLIQAVDTPTNVCPSIHVASAMEMDLAICRSVLGQRRWVRMLANSVFVLICLSTVFLKQHSVIDIFWGVAVTAVLHLVFSRRFMPEPTRELVHS